MTAIKLSLLLLSCLSISHGWVCNQGPQHSGAAQIDAGQGQVVMRDGNSKVYFLSGSAWNTLGSTDLKHVTVGAAGIWGVDNSHNVYKYIAGHFTPSTGQQLSQVDAGGDGQIVGVTSSSSIHCLKKAAALSFKEVNLLSWETLLGELMYISCSPHKCWGVNKVDQIFHTEISPDSCGITGWIQVDGTAKMVEVGTDGNVFAVNADGNLYQRTGITPDHQVGTGWKHIPMSQTIQHATYDLGLLWLTTSTGVILKCSDSGWQCKQGPRHSGAKQIDAGKGEVVMTDVNFEAYFLSGCNWKRLGTVQLQHVSVGSAGTWGVDSSYNVYKFLGGDFILSTGQKLSQVDAGGDGEVVGVTNTTTIHCLKSYLASSVNEGGSVNWTTIPGNLVYFSCSPLSCWGVNTDDNIFFTTITPETCEISGWTQIGGAAKMVEVGSDGTVFVVNADGHLYQRTGVTAVAPQGTDWVNVPLPLNITHATYDQGILWLTTTADVILECTR